MVADSGREEPQEGSVRRRWPRRLALLAPLVAAAAAGWLLAPDDEARFAAPDGAASGWYGLDPAGAVGVSEERARALSLPYAAAGAERPAARRGVVLLDRERATPGGTLYVSGHGPEALLVTLDGRPGWRWRHPFARAFPGRRPTADSGFFRRAALLADGDLLALIQGAGILRLDRRSRPRWVSPLPAYNHLLLHEGRVVTLTKRLATVAGATEPVLEDFLVELDAATGAEVRRVSILAALLASPWRAVGEQAIASGRADLLHANTVVPFGAEHAGLHPAFAAGRFLLSLRDVDALVVLDSESEQLIALWRGAWRRQHQPTLLDDGTLALFDNRGGEGGGARVVRVDLATGEVVWQHPPAGEPPLHSPQAGSLQALPDGHLLVTESERGRAFELTAEGEIVWEMRSPHRAGPREELVANLFEAVRVPWPAWLEETR